MILHNRKRKNYDRKNDERNEEEKKNIYDRDIIYEQIYSLPKKNKPRCLVISDYKNNLLRYFSNIVKVENYGSKDFRSKWYIHFYKICLYNEKIYGGVSGGNKKNIDKLIMEYNVEDVLRKLQTLVVRRLDCENLYYQKILVITCLLFDFFQNKKHVNIKSLKHLEGEEDDTKNTENDPNVEDDEEENDKKNNIDDKNIEYLNGKHIKDKYNKKVSKKRSRKNSSRSNYYDEYDDSIYSSNKDEDSSEYMMANRRKDHKIEIRKDHPGDINYHKNYYIIEFKNILYNEKKKFNNLEIFYHISNFIIHRYWYSQEYSTYNIFIWFLNYMHSKLEIRKSIQKINEQLEMFINIHPKIFNISHAKKKRKKNNNNSYNTNSTGRYFENGVLDYPYIKNRQKQIGGGFSDMADVEKKNKQNLPNLNTFGNNVMNNHSFFNNTMNNINNKNITLTNNLNNNNGTTSGLSLNSFNSPFKSFDQSNNIFSSKNGENSLFKKTITLTNNLSNNNNNNNINSNNLSSSSLFNNSFGNNTSTGNNTAGSSLSKFNLGFSNIQNNNNNNNMNAFNVGMNKTNIMTPGSSLFGDKSMLSNNTSNVINMNNANNINSMNNNLLLNSTQNKQVNLFENNNNNNNNMSNVNKSTNGLFGFEKNNFNSIFGNNSNKEKTNIFSFNSNQSQNTLFENKQINNISNTMSNNKDILGNTQNNSVSTNLFGSNITNVNSNMSLNSKSLFDNSMNNQKSNIFSSVKPNESLFSSNNNNNNNSNSSTTVASGPSNIFGAPLSNTQQSPFSKTTNNTFGNLNIDSNNSNNNMIITGNGANNNTGLNFNSSNITNSVTQMNVNNQTFNNPLNNVVQNDNNLINLFNNENGSKELFKDLKINNDSGPKFTVNKKPLFSRRATKNSTLSTNTLNQENNIFSSSYMNKDNLLNNQEKPLKVIFGQNNTSNENVTNVNTTINSSSVNNTTLFNAPNNNNNNNNNILSTNVEKNLFGQTNNLLKGSSSIMFNSASLSGTTNTINNNIDNNNNNSSSLNNNSSGGISGGLFGNKNLFGNTTNLFGNNNNNNNNNITNNNSDNVENNMLFNCNDPNNNTPNLSIPVKKLTLEERKKKTSKNSMLSLFSNNNNNTNENQNGDNTLNDLSKNFINNNTTNLNNTSSLFNFKSNNENNNDNTTQTTSTIFGFNTKDKQTTWGDNKITFGLSNNNLLANQENKETNKNTLDNVSSTNTSENKPAKKINIFGSSGSLFKTTEKTDEKTDEKEDDKEKQKTSEENKIKNIFQFNTKDEKNDNKGETKDNLLSKSDVNINKESDKEKNNKEENVVKGTIFGFSKDKDSLFGSSINNDDKSKINLFGSTMNDGDKNKTNLFGSLNKDDKDKPSIFGSPSNKDDKDKATIFGSPSNKDVKDKAPIFGFSSNKDDKDKATIFGSPSNKDDKDKAPIFGSPSNKDDKDKAPIFGFSSNKDDKDKAPNFGFSSNKDDKDKAPIFGFSSNKDDKDKAPIFGSPSNKDDKDKTPIFGSPSNKDDKDKTPIFGCPSNKDDKDKTAIFGGSTFGNNKSPMFGQGILNKGDNVSVPVFGNTVTSTDNDKSKLKLFNGNKDKEETKENVFISKDNINNNIFNNDNMKYVLSVTKVDDENKSKQNINYDDVLNRKRRRNVDDKNETNSNADERDKDDDRYGRKQVGKGFNVNSSNVSNDKNNLKNKRNENNMFNNDEDLFLKKSKVGNALNATKNMLETLKYDNIPSKDILNESIVNKNMDTSENVIVEHNVLNASATFLEDGKNNNMINMNNYSDDKDGFFSSSQIGNKISPIKDATIKEVNINNKDMNENNSNTYLTHNNNNNMMVMMNNVKNDEGNKMHLINKQYIKDKGLYDSLYDNNDYENLNVKEYLMDINNEHNNYNDNIRNNKKGINNNNNNNSTYVNKKEMDRIVQYNKKISFDDIVVDLDKDMIDLNELRQNLFLCAINFHLNYWAEKVILFYPHNEKINKYCTKLIRIKNEFDDTYDFSLFEYIHEISRKLLKTLDRNSCIYESVVFLSAENLYVLKNAQLSLFEAFIIYHFWYQKNSVDIKKNFRNFLYTNKIYPCYVNYYMNMYKNYKSFNGKSAEFNKNMSKRIRDNDHMVSNMNHMEDANHMKDLNHNNNGDIKNYQGNFLNVENNNSSRHSSKGGSFLLPPSSASNGNSKYSVVNLKHCSSASNRTHASDYSNNRSEESDYSSSDKKGYKNGNMNTNSNSSYDDYTSDCNKSQSNDYSEDSQRGRENKYDVYSDRRNRNKDDNDNDDDDDDNTYDEYNDSRNTYSYESNSDESNSLNKRRRKRKMNNNRNLKKNGTKYNKYKKKNVNENSLIDILNSNSSSSENSSDILDNNSNMDEPLNMNIKEKYIYFSKEKKKKKKKLILPGHIKIKKLSACECVLLELLLKNDILNVLRKYKIFKTEKYEYLYVNLLAMLKHYNYFSTIESDENINENKEKNHKNMTNMKQNNNNNNNYNNNSNRNLKRISEHLNSNCIINTKNDKINILKKICDKNLLYYINMQLKNISHLISYKEIEIACTYLNNIKNNLYVMFQLPIILYNVLFEKTINSFNDYIILDNFFSNSCVYKDFRYEYIFKTKIAYMLIKKFYAADDIENTIRFAIYFEECKNKTQKNNIYNDYIFHKNLINSYIKVHEHIVPSEWFHLQNYNTGHKNSGSVSNSRSDSISGSNNLNDMNDSEYLDYYSFFFKDISKYIKFHIIEKIINSNIYGLHKEDYSINGCNKSDDSSMINNKPYNIITSNNYNNNNNNNNDNIHYEERHFSCYFLYMVNKSILDELVNIYSLKGEYFYKRISTCLIKSSLVKDYEKSQNKHFHMYVQLANINHFMKNHFFEYINFFKKKELYHIEKTKNEDEIMENLTNVIKANGKKIILVINTLVEIINKIEREIIKDINIFVTINFRNLIIDTLYLFKYIFNNKEFSLSMVDDLYRNVIIFNDVINSTWKDDVHFYPKEQIKELYTHIRHKFMNQNMIN